MRIIDISNIKLISVNNKYNKNFSLKKEYKEFKQLLYNNCRNIQLSGPYIVHIHITCYIDIDNPVKPVLDALEARGVISNDRLVYRMIVDKDPIKRGAPGSITVDVCRYDGK